MAGGHICDNEAQELLNRASEREDRQISARLGCNTPVRRVRGGLDVAVRDYCAHDKNGLLYTARCMRQVCTLPANCPLFRAAPWTDGSRVCSPPAK